MGFADYSKEFFAETDAYETGLGEILSQKQDECPPRVIAYANRTVRPLEMRNNCSSMKFEIFSLKWTVCDKFRSYL